MNAPLPENIRKTLALVDLDDRYALERGTTFMSGVQALVKLPMLQRARDAHLGKDTAGFISGYRGSPLGNYDQALWKANKFLKPQNIVFQPGVNEELAATAVWGTQQLGFSPVGTNRHDGVFGIWYGKGPGVDRSIDAFKHANMAGTTPWGGVLAVAGDDHVSKSSTLAHQSDQVFQACSMPVFFPANVQEILDYGIHAFAMSRYTGLWAGMKTIQEIVESSTTVIIDPERIEAVIPEDFELPADGLHIRWPDEPLAQEERLLRHKLPAALAYIRANRLNQTVIHGVHDRFGIMASGKAYNDARQALVDLGLDDTLCRQLGIRVHKVGVVWPLEPQLARDFAIGLEEVLVIEEKRALLEPQLKDVLYAYEGVPRPRITGKLDDPGADGEVAGLLRAHADLTPALIARALVHRLRAVGVLASAPAEVQARIDAHLALLETKAQSLLAVSTVGKIEDRQPWFCSGCPHNTSTRVPEGSRAMAGIGCSFMAVWMDRSTIGYTQMGAEGTPWIGQQPFTTDQHIFANVGDGTYFHSGLLAIRQSIAAGVNITYKILYNDAVAMTGGQQVGERPEGHSVIQIAQSLQAEGTARVVIVTDEPEKYNNIEIAGNPLVKHRDLLDEIQREFRQIPGTTAIIYDQTCATEKRRRRKRGLAVDPARRVVINELVCEGCGDCGVQSNCLSVEPLETEFGRKRAINQNSCNKDMSCLKGFCPSFVSVEGGQLKKKSKPKQGALSPAAGGPLPEPKQPSLSNARVWGVLVAGVGGTGVITIGQLLGMAAYLDGKGVVTQDAAGLAQKGGATWSHVLIAEVQSSIQTTRVSEAAADLVLACDPVVAVGAETLARMVGGRTYVALNRQGVPTAGFLRDGNWRNPQDDCRQLIAATVGEKRVGSFDVASAATALMGDTIYVNLMLLGYAWQQGQLPLSLGSLMRAIELNGVSVDGNKEAFDWGRLAAARPAELAQALQPNQVVRFTPRETVESLVKRRVEFLTDYQNVAYADRYRSFISKVQQREQMVTGKTSLTEAVARNLFKLMAYKDEYEVARLHADPAFRARIAEQFEGDYKLNFYLAPPLFAKRDTKGYLVKRRFGPWVMLIFRLLARLKGLRGGALDVFGYTQERRSERALIETYRNTIDELLPGLNGENHTIALKLARIPDQIRGFGHIKERNLVTAQNKQQELMTRWRAQLSKAEPHGAVLAKS